MPVPHRSRNLLPFNQTSIAPPGSLPPCTFYAALGANLLPLQNQCELKQKTGQLVPRWQQTRKAATHKTFADLVNTLCKTLRVSEWPFKTVPY